jgi:hypothetical protein
MPTKRRPPPSFVFDCCVFSTPLSSLHQCPRVSMAAARAQRRIIPRIHRSTPVDTQGCGARYDAVPLLLLIVAYFFPVDCRGRWRHGRNGGGGKDARDVVVVAVLSPPVLAPFLLLRTLSRMSSSSSLLFSAAAAAAGLMMIGKRERDDNDNVDDNRSSPPPPRSPSSQNDVRETSQCGAPGEGGGKRTRMKDGK